MPEEPLSQNQLAKRLGWSVQRLLWHRKNKPDAPKENDLAAWQRYTAAHSYVMPGNSGNGAKAVLKDIAVLKRDILLEVKADKKRANRIKDNEIFDSKEVTQFLGNLVGFFFAELDRLSSEFPVTLKGRQEIPIHEECIRQGKAIKQALIDRVKAWDAKHDKTTTINLQSGVAETEPRKDA